MNKRKVVEIAARIYGLYLLTQLPMVLAGILPAFSLDNEKFVKHPSVYQAWALIAPLLYLLIAYILISKSISISKVIAGKEYNSITKQKDEILPHSQLSFWVTLLGLYFIVTSASQIVKNIISYPIYAGDSFTLGLFASQGLILFAGLYMTFRSKKVEAFIQKKSIGKS